MFESKRCKVINSCWDPRGISGNESQVWQHPVGWAEHIAQAVAQLPVIILKRGLLNPATIKFGVQTPQPNPGWPPSCKRPSTALTPTWRRWTRLTFRGCWRFWWSDPCLKTFSRYGLLCICTVYEGPFIHLWAFHVFESWQSLGAYLRIPNFYLRMEKTIRGIYKESQKLHLPQPLFATMSTSQTIWWEK